MSRDTKRYPLRSEDTAHRILDDEAIIVHFKASLFYTFNPVGTFIWERCDGQHTLEQIVAELVENYDLSPERSTSDCQKFIDELVLEGLLEWAESPKTLIKAER